MELWIQLASIIVPTIALIGGLAVAKYKVTQAATELSGLREKVDGLETWQSESKGRVLVCQNQLKEEVAQSETLVNTRIDGAFKRIDEVRSEMGGIKNAFGVQVERHNNMKEALQELKTEMKEVKDGVNQILLRLSQGTSHE